MSTINSILKMNYKKQIELQSREKLISRKILQSIQDLNKTSIRKKFLKALILFKLFKGINMKPINFLTIILSCFMLMSCGGSSSSDDMNAESSVTETEIDANTNTKNENGTTEDQSNNPSPDSHEPFTLKISGNIDIANIDNRKIQACLDINCEFTIDFDEFNDQEKYQIEIASKQLNDSEILIVKLSYTQADTESCLGEESDEDCTVQKKELRTALPLLDFYKEAKDVETETNIDVLTELTITTAEKSIQGSELTLESIDYGQSTVKDIFAIEPDTDLLSPNKETTEDSNAYTSFLAKTLLENDFLNDYLNAIKGQKAEKNLLEETLITLEEEANKLNSGSFKDLIEQRIQEFQANINSFCDSDSCDIAISQAAARNHSSIPDFAKEFPINIKIYDYTMEVTRGVNGEYGKLKYVYKYKSFPYGLDFVDVKVIQLESCDWSPLNKDANDIDTIELINKSNCQLLASQALHGFFHGAATTYPSRIPFCTKNCYDDFGWWALVYAYNAKDMHEALVGVQLMHIYLGTDFFKFASGKYYSEQDGTEYLIGENISIFDIDYNKAVTEEGYTIYDVMIKQ